MIWKANCSLWILSPSRVAMNTLDPSVVWTVRGHLVVLRGLTLMPRSRRHMRQSGGSLEVFPGRPLPCVLWHIDQFVEGVAVKLKEKR